MDVAEVEKRRNGVAKRTKDELWMVREYVGHFA